MEASKDDTRPLNSVRGSIAVPYKIYLYINLIFYLKKLLNMANLLMFI